MLNNFCVFEELVFFDLWIPDSGFRIPILESGFRFPGFRVALIWVVLMTCQQLGSGSSTQRTSANGRGAIILKEK